MAIIVSGDNNFTPVTGKQDPFISFRNVDPEHTGDHRVELIPAVKAPVQFIARVNEEIDFVETAEGRGFCLSNDMCALSAGQLTINSYKLSSVSAGDRVVLIDKRRQKTIADFELTTTDYHELAELIAIELRKTGLTVYYDGEYRLIYVSNYTAANITLELRVKLALDTGEEWDFIEGIPFDVTMDSDGYFRFRFCASPHPDVHILKCPTNTSYHLPVEMDGVFDVFVDDMHVPDGVNMTIEDILARYTEEHPKLWVSEYVRPDVCTVAPSEWSNDITYDMINLPSSSGHISMNMGYAEFGGFWNSAISLTNNTTVMSAFTALRDGEGCPIEVREGTIPDSVQIRYMPQYASVGEYPGWEQSYSEFTQSPTGGLVDNRDNEYYQGTNAETICYMSDFFTNPPMVSYCRDPNAPVES